MQWASLLLVGVLCTFMAGCATEDLTVDYTSGGPSEISLTSPKGVILANSPAELQNRIAVLDRATEAAAIYLIGITYHEGASQTGAMVEYLDKYGAQKSIIFVTPKHPQNASVAALEFSIILDCTGTCGCRERAIFNPDGSMSYECTCEDCAMDVTYG